MEKILLKILVKNDHFKTFKIIDLPRVSRVLWVLRAENDIKGKKVLDSEIAEVGFGHSHLQNW